MKKMLLVLAAIIILALITLPVSAATYVYDPTPLLDYDGDVIATLPYLTKVVYQWTKPMDSSQACVYVPGLELYGYIPAFWITGEIPEDYSDKTYSYTTPAPAPVTTPAPTPTPAPVQTYSYYSPSAWVDVDISDQICRLYVGSEVIAWDYCVTGNAYESPTPIGEWSVAYKQSPATLCGTSPAGKEYATPVDYWMPFCGGCGLHDSAREVFGGDIYTWGGSYGCVNLPHWLAEKIYSYVDSGSPVIVHE